VNKIVNASKESDDWDKCINDALAKMPQKLFERAKNILDHTVDGLKIICNRFRQKVERVKVDFYIKHFEAQQEFMNKVIAAINERIFADKQKTIFQSNLSPNGICFNMHKQNDDLVCDRKESTLPNIHNKGNRFEEIIVDENLRLEADEELGSFV
jgi:hypothetical protein